MLFPTVRLRGGVDDASRAEYVRVTGDQLLRYRIYDVIEIEQTLFLRQLRLKYDLKQEIPQLFS